MSREVLIIDDDKATRQWLASVLQAETYICHCAQDAEEADEILQQHDIWLALVDIYLGNASGLSLLTRIRAIRPGCDCVMMTAHASVETMARSLSDGAAEYLGKPLRIDELMTVIRRLESRRSQSASECLEDKQSEMFAGTAIVGSSPKMLDVYRAIVRAAPTNATVLILGPSGSGKEQIARAIHAHSRRAGQPFTAVNCGALAEGVLESELFGHEKGAFTGAEVSRRGLFESTQHGTIFLDEISETTSAFQVKLLRVLQERQLRRLGSNNFTSIDVRILAASNADLDLRIRAKQFREDLFYRLSVVTISVPPLGERREDIPLLALHFVRRFNERYDRSVVIHKAAIACLANMDWPGNVRELENLIERTAIMSITGEITEADIEVARGTFASSLPASQAVGSSLKSAERTLIVNALLEAEGNRSLAARRLGIERKTLYKKALRLGINLDSPDR